MDWGDPSDPISDMDPFYENPYYDPYSYGPEYMPDYGPSDPWDYGYGETTVPGSGHFNEQGEYVQDRSMGSKIGDFLKNVLSGSGSGKSSGNPASSVGQQAGSTARGMAEGRATESELALRRDISRNQVFNARQQAELERFRLGLVAPSARGAQAARGDLMANVQDVRAEHPRANVVHFEGGARPSLLSDSTRQLGSDLSRQALLDQLAGNEPTMLPPPKEMELPSASGAEKALGGVGIGAGILGALWPYLFSDKDEDEGTVYGAQ